MHADDAARLVRFHEALDPHDQYLRFFAPHPHLSATEVEYFTQVDHVDREALVVVCGDEIVGVGRYDRLHDDPATAEIAFVVAGPWRGKGLATALLHALAAVARANGITTFVAESFAGNRRMIDVFRHAGYEMTARITQGVQETRLDLAPSNGPAS